MSSDPGGDTRSSRDAHQRPIGSSRMPALVGYARAGFVAPSPCSLPDGGPYRTAAGPTDGESPPRSWPVLDAEIAILVSCTPVVLHGLVRGIFGSLETSALIGVVGSIRAIGSALRRANRSRREIRGRPRTVGRPAVQ
jgi:hypothetical protein